MERTGGVLQAIRQMGKQLYYFLSRCQKTYGVSQYDKNSAYIMSFRNMWNEGEFQLFEKLTTELIKGEGKYKHGKLKTWKDCVNINFHDQDVPHNATAVLKIDSA